MRRKIILLLLLLPLVVFGRTWTDTKGRTFDGDLISYDGHEVTIKRKIDQQVFTIDISVLSNSDRHYLEKKKGNKEILAPSSNEILAAGLGMLALIVYMVIGGKFLSFQDWGIFRSLVVVVINILAVIAGSIAYALCFAMKAVSIEAMPVFMIISLIFGLFASASFIKESVFKVLFFLVVTYLAAFLTSELIEIGLGYA